MKTLIAISLAISMTAGATTITINKDTGSILEFNLVWGQTIDGSSVTKTGPNGSVVSWQAQTTDNPNYYFVSVNSPLADSHQGFGLWFWFDHDYAGPVPTEFGAQNMVIGSSANDIRPLAGEPYGARFVYWVPELDGTWAMMLMGLAGIAAATFIDRKTKQS